MARISITVTRGLSSRKSGTSSRPIALPILAQSASASLPVRILVESTRDSLELSLLARTALELAQKFNTIYNKHPILKEENEELRATRLATALVFYRALETLADDRAFDLVLMDIMMPGMDGYETIERIRAQDRFRALPIIALTAKAGQEDRTRSFAAGADDYVAKPVEPGTLVETLARHLDSVNKPRHDIRSGP